MFIIKIAEMLVGIENKYDFVRKQCIEYICDGVPDIIIKISDDEIAAEKQNNTFSDGYCESVCIYRAMCFELIKYDCFLMHASVVSLDDEGYAFLADSGTGKTTQAELWCKYFGQRAFIVNGDKPIIKLVGNFFYAYGTPWCGKENKGRNTLVRLKNIYFLERSRLNSVFRAEESEIVERLFRQLLIPPDRTGMLRLLYMAGKMLQTLNFYILKCSISYKAVESAYSAELHKIMPFI